MLNETAAEMNDENFQDLSDQTDEGTELESFDDLPTTFSDDKPVDEKPKADKKDKPADSLKTLSDASKDEKGPEVLGDKKDKKEAKDAKEDEKDDEEVEEESKELKADGEKTDEKKGSAKIRLGDELFNIDDSASVRVKVDGKYQDVPLKELMGNYSGKVTWDKKFSEIGQQKSKLEKDMKVVSESKAQLQNHIKAVLDIVNDNSKDPFDALSYLVDLAGGNSYDFYKRSIESRMEEYDKLLNMNDVERKLYFAEKQNEHLAKQVQAAKAKDTEAQTYQEYAANLLKLQQQAGVSKEDYVKAHDELLELGHKDDQITDEFIVEWASLKPHIETIEGILTPYESEVSEWGVEVQRYAEALKKGISLAAIKQDIEAKYAITKDAKELNSRLKKTHGAKKPEAPRKESNVVESFDDLF